MEEIFDIAIPEVEKVEKPVNDIITTAKAMQVTNQDERNNAGNFIKNIKDMQKEVTKTFRDMVETTKSAYDKAKALRDKFLDPLEIAEEDLKNKSIAWEKEQENIRRKEQARLLKEAEEQAEIQRKALEVEAKKLAKKGDTERAEALRQASKNVTVEMPIVYPTVQKVKGQSLVDHYSGQVTNIMDLAKEVVSGRAPSSYLTGNMTEINYDVRKKQDSFVCPGIKVVIETSMSSKGNSL